MGGEGWRRVERVDPKDDFPAAGRLDGREIAIFRTPDGYRATEQACPHQQANMVRATLQSNGTMVRCPMHAFTFRLSDGKGVNCPGFRIRVYEIAEQDGALYGRAAT